MSDLGPEAAIYLVWFVWVVSWFLAAAWSSKAQSRPGLKVEAAYRRGDLFEKRRALAETWGRYCATPGPQRAEIVALRA